MKSTITPSIELKVTPTNSQPTFRTIIYGSILSIAVGGLYYFRKSTYASFFLSPKAKKIDLFCSDIPLQLSTLAAIDSIHYASEIICNYKLLNTKQKHNICIHLAISSYLGFIYPLFHIINTDNTDRYHIKLKHQSLLRNEFKPFCKHMLFGGVFITTAKYIVFPITLFGSLFTFGMGFILSVAYPITKRVAAPLLWSPFKWPALVFNKAERIETWCLSSTQKILNFPFANMEEFIWSSLFISNVYQLTINGILSKYYEPILFQKKARLAELDDKYFYEEYVEYLEIEHIPKDILCQIFEFSGMAIHIQELIVEDNECVVKSERKYTYIYELKMIATICFAYLSYKQMIKRTEQYQLNEN